MENKIPDKDPLEINNAQNAEVAYQIGTSKTIKEGDIALQILGNDSPGFEFDKANGRKVMRKIDCRILSLLCLTTLLQFLDKSTLSYASIFGIIHDTGLVGTDYSWLSSIFYFGYMGMQPAAAFFLQRFSPARCLAVSVFSWGIILFLHVVCDNWTKLMVIRFILGAAESIVTPAFILISSAWYPRQAQPLRMGLIWAFNGVAIVVGGVLAYGIGQIHTGHLASWKWLYLITASLSVVWSVILFFILPESQVTASCLSENEKRIAIEMVRSNNTGIYNKTFKKEQLIEALLAIKSWIFVTLAFLFNVPNSLSTFDTLVISNFGFSTLATTVLSMPSGGFEVVIMLVTTSLCIMKPNARLWCISTAVLIALFGAVLVFALPYHNKAGLLAGYCFGYIIMLSLVTANTAGYTKKVTVNAMILIGYCVGNIVGPQFFLTRQKPRYRLGIGAILTCFGLIIVLLVALWLYLQRQNKHRAATVEHTLDANFEANLEFQDLTDKENPNLLYVY